jgi:hypothetical protein
MLLCPCCWVCTIILAFVVIAVVASLRVLSKFDARPSVVATGVLSMLLLALTTLTRSNLCFKPTEEKSDHQNNTKRERRFAWSSHTPATQNALLCQIRRSLE